MAVEIEPISSNQEFIIVPKFTPDNSMVDLCGRLIGKKGVFPQGAIDPFPETVVIDINSRLKRKLSKKKKLAIGVGFAFGYALGGVGLSAYESNQDMRNAQVTSTEFVTQNEQMLENKEIGISFDQEDYPSTQEALKALDFFHNQLGITHFRIKPGDMKNDAKTVNGKIEYNFSKSKPIIDKIINYKNAHFIPDLGAKEFGWPEQRVSDQYQQELIDASNGSGIIKPDSNLAREAINYENAFVNFLLANYTDEQLNSIEGFEFENEPYNKFGDNPVRMENVEQSIENNMKTFPKKVKYLVNSAGFFNVDEITNNFKDLISKYPELKNRLIMGIDYYRDVGSVDTPFGRIDPMNWPIVGRNADEIVWDKSLGIFGNKLTNLVQNGKDIGFETQATEDGIGPWGGYEDNKSEFPADLTNVQYSIERVSRFADPNKEFTIGAWKLGDLYNERNNPRYSHDIKEIFDLIKKINTKDKDAQVDINLS